MIRRWHQMNRAELRILIIDEVAEGQQDDTITLIVKHGMVILHTMDTYLVIQGLRRRCLSQQGWKMTDR